MSVDGGLRKLFHEHLKMVHWQAVETGGSGSGVPDSNGCCKGVDFWVEHRHTNHWAVGLNPFQVGWIDRRHRAGGRVWIAVRQTRGLEDNLWLFAGGVVRELAAEGLRCARERQRWGGGPTRWDWGEVLRVLTFTAEPAATAGLPILDRRRL